MANLAEAVDATETDWIISADVSDAIDFFTVEDEIVKVTGNFPAQYQRGEGTTTAPRLRVERGAGGTTAASHADATALTPLIPPSSSGAAEGGVTINLTGTETEPGNFFRGDEDPADTPAYLAILETGDQWIDTTGGYPYQQKVRNDANDGWEPAQLVVKDFEGNILTSVVLADDGSFTITNAEADIFLSPEGVFSANQSTFGGDSSVSLAAGVATLGADGAVDIGGKFGLTAGGELTLGDAIVIPQVGGPISMLAELLLLNLPSADPEVDGQLYTDGVVSAGVPQPLMVSGGPA